MSGCWEALLLLRFIARLTPSLFRLSLPFLESNLDRGVCYRVFYGQMVRFQRLCTYREDFEARARYLLDVLRARGYRLDLLGRQFLRAIGKYISDFQRWEIPVSIEGWFRDIAGL